MQKEIIASLLEISKVLLETSRIHKEMRADVIRQHERFESTIATHSGTCKDQFNTLEKKFDKILDKE